MVYVAEISICYKREILKVRLTVFVVIFHYNRQVNQIKKGATFM